MPGSPLEFSGHDSPWLDDPDLSGHRKHHGAEGGQLRSPKFHAYDGTVERGRPSRRGHERGNHRPQQAEILLSHPAIKGISFVGSTKVGRHIYKTAAANGKRVQALCEAKNHALVLKDCKLERTARGIINAFAAAPGSAVWRCRPWSWKTPLRTSSPVTEEIARK